MAKSKKPIEGNTTEEKVDKVTSKEETLHLAHDEVAMKLKSGKGGVIKVKRNSISLYEKDFEIVAKGKKK